MATDPAAQLDLISQLQEQVNALCAKLFNFLGALQRDAPPVSVNGEGLLAPSSGVDVEAQTELMAGELVESFRAMEQRIRALPSTDRTEAEQVAEITALQERNASASEALREELSAAEATLAQLQGVFGVLADLQLARRGRSGVQAPSGGQQPGRQAQPGAPVGGPS